MSFNSASASVSVVVVSHNEGDNLRRTIHSLLAGLPADGEIIVVDDCSTDGSTACLNDRYANVAVVRPGERLGVARARNFGGQRAKGQMLVFCDAHVAAPLGWAAALAAALAQEGAGAVGPAISAMHNPQHKGYGMRWADAALNLDWLGLQGQTPYPVPLLCGCFIALRRELFVAIGGFDPGLVVWGCEDSELSLRLWTRGYACLLVPEVEIAHLFRPTHPYRVDWEVLIYNTLRMATMHFGPDRLRRIVAGLTTRSNFPAAFARLADSDAWARRQQIHAERLYDDSWFFRRFGMDNV